MRNCARKKRNGDDMTGQHHHYMIHGLAVRSSFRFDGVVERDSDPVPDPVIVELGEVPERIAAPDIDEPMRQFAANAYLREIPGIARLWITDGRRIVVRPDPGHDRGALVNIITNLGLSMIGFQRGYLPLHAATIAVGGNAVGFAGASGAGKSTLAAALALRDYAWHGDDLCLARIEGPTGMRVGRGPDYLRLRDDAAAHLGSAYHPRAGTRQADGKSSFRPVPADAGTDLPLRRLYLPRPLAPGAEPRIQRIAPVDALAPLVDAVRLTASMLTAGLADRSFRIMVELANRVELYWFDRPWTLDKFDAALDLLEGHLATLIPAPIETP